MKKILCLATTMLITLNSINAQVYMGTDINNKGVGANLGFLGDHLDINTGINIPLSRTDVATIAHFTTGYMINLTHKDEDNFTITPSIGMGSYHIKDYTAYNLDPHQGPTKISEILPYYSLELGKDAYMGRISLKLSYCKEVIAGISMRIFFARDNH